MQHTETTRRILQAAVALFAEQGISETTLRQITARADVNLAAVNYHFGSKDRLIVAVADACIGPLVDSMEAVLAERLAPAPHAVTLEELMELLMHSLLQVNKQNREILAVFTRLLDLAYIRNQQGLRSFLAERFGARMQPFLTQLRGEAAPMDDDEFFWRLHFLLGSVIFTLSNFQTLASIERQAFERSAEVERILYQMVPVLAAGFQARVETACVYR